MNGSQAITEEAARAIGVDAYLYFYPPHSPMDIKHGSNPRTLKLGKSSAKVR